MVVNKKKSSNPEPRLSCYVFSWAFGVVVRISCFFSRSGIDEGFACEITRKKIYFSFCFLFCFLSFMTWNVREMENWEVFSTLCIMAQWKCYWWNILVGVFKTFCMVCKYCDCRFVMHFTVAFWILFHFRSVYGIHLSGNFLLLIFCLSRSKYLFNLFISYDKWNYKREIEEISTVKIGKIITFAKK